MKQRMGPLLLCLLCALLPLSGCGSQNTGGTSDTATENTVTGETAEAALSLLDTASTFSDRDLEGTWDENEAVDITLSGDTASCEASAVTVDGARVTITGEGVYRLTGSLSDGQIVVDAPDTDKVQLVLDGADITCSSSAAIYALEADKVFITLAEGTENSLANGGSYESIDENNIDAVIFAKTDLTLNGSGGLVITAPAGHGVVSKDDLVVTGGSYEITAAGHGLSGKDSVAIAGGSFVITSGKDGIHAENADDPALGTLYLADGTFTITAQGDAVSAEGALQIDAGTFTLTTGGGSGSVELTADSFDPGQRGERPSQSEDTEEAEETASQKGIKSEGTFTILGGTFTADTVDDCLHAAGEMSIDAGTFHLSSGDDAVHCDSALVIRNGDFTIPYCYEGLEGLSITIEDGTYDIRSTDDGLNAAGGADSSGFGGRGQDRFAGMGEGWPSGGAEAAAADASGGMSAQTDGMFIVIRGGTFTIVSGGDCIDSNGDLTIDGGTLDLTCNSSMNTALDCDGAYTNSGGDVTTNDGSEEDPGRMGGGMSGHGGRPDGGFNGEMPEGGPPSDGEPPEGLEPGEGAGEKAPPPNGTGRES